MWGLLKKLTKDLLYTGGNEALDIARLSSLIAVIAYWAGVFIKQHHSGAFDPVEVGTGWGLVAAGSGGWIFARQTKETPAADTTTTTATVQKVERRTAPEGEIV